MKIKIFTLWTIMISSAICQQIDIPRIEQMPNQPEPYEMRDWKKVTLGYDSLVFDFSLSGQYLPLIWLSTQTVNYPEHNSFGLHTAVGTNSPNNAEAINVLPAVVGATLAGIDKSDQNGTNWVLMCEEFFNNRPEENVYLNGWIISSGNDCIHNRKGIHEIMKGLAGQILFSSSDQHQGIICCVAIDRSSLQRIAPYASVVTPRRLTSNTLLLIRYAA